MNPVSCPARLRRTRPQSNGAGLGGDGLRAKELLEKKNDETAVRPVPVALSGIVRCRVDAGYGAIQPGDLVVTSFTPGHAMRFDDPRPSTILGKALEPIDVGTGLIKVQLMLR